MRGFWLGVLATLLAGAVVVLAFLGLGFMPVSADAKPGTFETWLAGFARDAAIERAAPDRESPVAATPENLAAAALLYRDNCAGCHGTPDAKENVFAASLYPPAPQFLSATAPGEPLRLRWRDLRRPARRHPVHGDAHLRAHAEGRGPVTAWSYT